LLPPTLDNIDVDSRIQRTSRSKEPDRVLAGAASLPAPARTGAILDGESGEDLKSGPYVS
jgi:hypothetical protein